MLRKRLTLPILLLLLSFLISSCAGLVPRRAVKHLSIIATSDIHSSVFPYEAIVEEDGVQSKMVIGGIDRIAGVAKRERGRSDGALLVLSGDGLMGGFYRSFGGIPEITAMNMAGYDAVTPGNHEFDLGVDFYKEAIKNAAFPVVCSNVTITDPELAARVNPFVIKEAAGIKIGIFGLITPDLVRISNVGSTVTVDPDLTAVSIEMVRLLKENGADIIVALTHVGKSLDEQIAREVAGIDVIVGGHTHDTLYETIAGPSGWQTIVVQAGVNGGQVGILRLTVAGRTVTTSRWKTVLLDRRAPSDRAVAAYLAPYKEKLKENLERTVGEALVDLDATNDSVRSRESNLGDLIADAWTARFVKEGAKRPIALVNGGAIRGNRIYPKGPVTYGDIVAIHSLPSTIYEVTLSGKELLAVLEMSASAIRVEGDGCLAGERVAEGGFLQVGGLRFRIDLSGRPFCAEYDGRSLKRIIFPGERVVSAEVMEGGKWVPIRRGKSYTVLVTSWTAGGGDGYFPFPGAEKRDTKVDIVDALSNYLTEKSPVRPEASGRIVIKGK